jgi:hypothetical protein
MRFWPFISGLEIKFPAASCGELNPKKLKARSERSSYLFEIVDNE